MISFGRLFAIWFKIGIQSFGGGTTTMTLIRRCAVDQEKWVSEELFNRDWALCQMTPGINLIALSILLGRRLSGWQGAVAATMGLLLPSALITVALTAAYVSIRDIPAVQAIVRGVLPASVGLGLVTGVQMARKPVTWSYEKGIGQLIFACLVILGSAFLLLTGKISVTIVLLSASFLGAIEGALRARREPKEGAD